MRAHDTAGNPGAWSAETETTTIDITDPTSQASAPATSQTTDFSVTWSGSDECIPDQCEPSGIVSYDVQYKDGNGPWTGWQTDTTAISATFSGQMRHTYHFQSRTRDLAGLVEAWPIQPDASTSVGPLITKYYYHGGKRVAMRQGGVVQYLHGDHLGSTSLTTDESGAMVARQLYHPYGTTRYSEGTLATDFGFMGQRNVAGIGLMDYNARFYAPTLGRFISADTIVPNPTNPQLLNRYSYAGNNPILYNDPDGHCGPLCIIGLVAVGLFVALTTNSCSGPAAHPSPASGETQFRYSEQYGWFDSTHLNDHNILEEVGDTVAAGGGEFTLHEAQVGDMHLYKTYRVSGDITEDQIAGVSLAIFMDFQGGWEAWQGENQEFFTAYAVEDLPSNMLAFIASLKGTTTDVLLDELGAYSTDEHEHPPDPQFGGPTAEFLPKRLNLDTGQYEEVSWPWDLPSPIDDPNLWGPVSASKVPLLGGDPQHFRYE